MDNNTRDNISRVEKPISTEDENIARIGDY